MSDIDSLIQALDEKLANTDDPLEMARIYYDAAQLFLQNQKIDEACFFMTQAFVFASHQGDKTLTNDSREFLQIYNRI